MEDFTDTIRRCVPQSDFETMATEITPTVRACASPHNHPSQPPTSVGRARHSVRAVPENRWRNEDENSQNPKIATV
jgi:hypothetical protein